MFAPGSMLWLLRHELRLQWRNTTNKIVASLGFLGALLLMHGIAIPIAIVLRASDRLPDAMVFASVTVMLLFVGLGMCSRALILLVQYVYERGDGDLLLSSPMSPKRVATARALAVALSLMYEFGGFIWPVANVCTAFGQPRWLLTYLVLPSLALLATAVSLWLALVLFKAVGPRRTRVLAQVGAGLLGSSGLLLSQLPQFWPAGERTDLIVLMFTRLPDVSDPMWWPARAALGHSTIAASVSVLLVGACFALSLQTSSRRFIDMVVHARSVSMTAPRRPPSPTLRQFHTGTVRVLIVKELRLVGRDPWLITQLVQQNLYLIPLFFGLWRALERGISFAWIAVVACSGTVAGALAWLAAAGEDAPELLLSAPLSPRALNRAKLTAALLPVLCLMWPPVLALLWQGKPWSALAIAVCSLGCALCSALLNLHWRTQHKPGVARKPRNLRSRYQSSGLLALWDFVGTSVWLALATVVMFWEH